MRPSGSGARTDASGRPLKNALLLSLREQDYSRLRTHLEPIELPQRFILQEPGEKIEFAHFLNEGLASLVVLTRDGRSVEVAIVGKEGMIGTPLAVALQWAPYRTIMQISGWGVRVGSGALEDTLRAAPEFRLALNRYVLIQGLQVAQIAACNRLHEVEQRLARWLLMCHDRVDSELLPVTHEFLAQMLGTGRPSVSLAAGILQRAGIIENVRRKLKILDRKGLETAACECYRAMQQFGNREAP